MSEFDRYTIEPFMDEYLIDPPEEYAVYGHGTYEDSSVLAGQYRRCFLDVFSSAEEAREAYPTAEESDSTKHITDQMMDAFENSPPPDWFDPADAGEEW